MNCYLVKESAGFLRIGSLNVRVKKTTDALNNLISRDVEARLHRSFGSSDSLPETVSFHKYNIGHVTTLQLHHYKLTSSQIYKK